MGITVQRAYKLQEKLTARIKDLMSQARHFHLTNEDIIDNMVQVRIHPDYHRAPRYVHAYCEGVYRTLREDIYNNRLMWVLSLDGKLVSSKEVDDLTLWEKEHFPIASKSCNVFPNGSSGYKSPWSRINNDLSRHVWKDVEGKPLLDKPFDARFLLTTPSGT